MTDHHEIRSPEGTVLHEWDGEPNYYMHTDPSGPIDYFLNGEHIGHKAGPDQPWKSAPGSLEALERLGRA